MGKQFVEFRKATTRTPAEIRPQTRAPIKAKVAVPKFDPYELNDAVKKSRLTQPNRFNFKSKNRVGTDQ